MNAEDQAAAYAAADWSESHGKIPGYFRERFPGFSGGKVLDLGCGAADVTIRFVKAYPNVTAVGVDGSEAMLEFGRRLPCQQKGDRCNHSFSFTVTTRSAATCSRTCFFPPGQAMAVWFSAPSCEMS